MIPLHRELVRVGPGGVVEIRDAELPVGRIVEVLVTEVDPEASPPSSQNGLVEPGKPRCPDFQAHFGKAGSSFANGAELDAFLRSERDAWE